jgi:farnesyl diphosphate synthase
MSENVPPNDSKSASAFNSARQTAVALVRAQLDDFLNPPKGPEKRLVEAMRYAALDGGKGFRPFLVLATSAMFGVPQAQAVRVAAALESVHCYSLAHDDLPAMDDDALRRGRPSLHKAYDEATAILAGDALLTLAFEILADGATHADANVRLALVASLAQAAGRQGMVGGQTLDILSPDLSLDMADLSRLQGLKTGALIGFSVEAGALLGAAEAAQTAALKAYAQELGLAFQIADDVLDVTGASQTLGKTAGKDVAEGKATFVSLLGLAGARQEAENRAAAALAHLAAFGSEAEPLRQAAQFVIHRKN